MDNIDRNSNKVNINNETEKMKYEIAQELGLAEKIEERGWSSLTSRESGAIGGIMRKRNRERRSWYNS